MSATASPSRGRGLALAALAAAAAIRIVYLRAFPGDVDTESYRAVVGILRAGGNLYRETPHYNYAPAWALVLLGCDAVARAIGWDLATVVGTLLSVVDLATAGVLLRLLRERRAAAPELAAALYFANPIAILIASHHGQFDGVGVFFLLLAILAVERRRDADVPAAGWLSLSLLFKHVAWFHPLLFAIRRPRSRAGILLLPYAVFAASFLPFAAAAPDIWRHVFEHRGQTGHYGFEFLLYLPGVPESRWLLTLLFAGAALAAVIWSRRLELPRASLLLFLVMLVFLPGFQEQYCLWPIAPGSLYPSAGFFVYVALASGFVVRATLARAATDSWLPGWYAPWWGALFWLLWEARALTHARPAALRPRTSDA